MVVGYIVNESFRFEACIHDKIAESRGELVRIAIPTFETRAGYFGISGHGQQHVVDTELMSWNSKLDRNDTS